MTSKKKSAANPWLVAGVAGMAAFMEILDISIANVALEYIAGSLSTSRDEATWVLTSYLITNAVILLTSGWFATVIGRKYYFMACIAGFSLTSLLCGMAPSLTFLIIFRGLQGLVGGGLQPSAQAILADAFPPEKRGMAFAIYGLAVVFAPAIGPTFGGWLTDQWSWRWVFLINVPVGIVLTLLTCQVISDTPEQEEARKKQRASIRFDYIGFSLLAIGMGALQVVLDRGQIDDWFNSNLITGLFIVTILSLAFFIVWELMTEQPIVDFSLLANPNFAIGNVMMFLLGFVLLGSTVLLPQYGQEILGYTATDAGKVISPGGFLLAAMMPMIGFLLGRMDARYMIGFGIVVCSFSLLYMTNFYQDIGYWTIALARVYQAAGFGFIFIPINTVAFHGVPKGKSNAASSIINMARNLGGSFGISYVTTMLARRSQVHQEYLVRHVQEGAAPYRATSERLQQYLMMHWSNSVDALHQAQGIIYRTVQQQARILAYIDDFQYLAVIFLMLLPFLFMLRKAKPGKAPQMEG